MVRILSEQLPMLNSEQIVDFMTVDVVYAMGLYPTTIMSENQCKAIEMVGVDYEKPNFTASLTNFTVNYIKGLMTE